MVKSSGLFVSGQAVAAAVLVGVVGFGLTGCAPGVADASNNVSLPAVTPSTIVLVPTVPAVPVSPSVAAPVVPAVGAVDEAARKLLAYNLCVAKILEKKSNVTEKWFAPVPFEQAEVVKRNDGGYFVRMVYTNLRLPNNYTSYAYCYILGDLAHPDFPAYGMGQSVVELDPNVVPESYE